MTYIHKRYNSYLIFLISHLEISGRDCNDLQAENVMTIPFTFLVTNLEIFGNNTNDLHPENKLSIFLIF